MRDVVVIGAGLSGLSAALRLLKAGREVDLITKGIGGIQLGQGTIDLYGYSPERVDNPLAAIDKLPQSHPYSKLGSQAVADSANWLKEQLGQIYWPAAQIRTYSCPPAWVLGAPPAYPNRQCWRARLRTARST
ncbi:MAG: FAD-dependent oxidoreductase [Varibaculum cambriense]